MTPEERNKPPKLDDFFIDLGRPKAEGDKLVGVGDPITRERELIEMGDCVNVKSLDNRASVFLLLETLRTLKKGRRKPAYDFYGVFTVQEEVGLRGANASAMEIQPDFGFGLDTTIAFDVPVPVFDGAQRPGNKIGCRIPTATGHHIRLAIHIYIGNGAAFVGIECQLFDLKLPGRFRTGQDRQGQEKHKSSHSHIHLRLRNIYVSDRSGVTTRNQF